MPSRDYYLPQRQLISQADSARIENANVPRSRFLNTFGHLTTFNAGYLIPILVDEILPGDHMRYDVTAYVRMATPIFPIFSNQRVDTHFFFVPNRLLWNNWVKMMGEQADPGDSIDYTVPEIESPAGSFAIGSIYDYFGIPIAGQIDPADAISVQALPFRAYNMIWNQWFRDQNMQDSAPTNVASNGPDTYTDYVLKQRAKSHDYFTSALPWPQKFTAPTVPLGGSAPVLGIGIAAPFDPDALSVSVRETEGTGVVGYAEAKLLTVDPSPAGNVYIKMAGPDDTYPQIYADLSTATGVTINVLRQAFLIQSLIERDARGGTRYVELLRSHFGVINPDFRLQRPEYIGGGQTPLVITPIAQTAPATEGELGALGGTGTAAGQHRASYAATEHGFIIGLLSVKTELTYQQGLHKMWTRSSRYDYYWPSLAALGEQAILRHEIYMIGDNVSDNTVFGYQERWHEYRTRYSIATGLFRSTSTGTIDPWHLGQRFTAAPVLGPDFIVDNPPMARVLAAGSSANNQQYLADILIRRDAVRPLPTYGTPATLGRF